MPGTLTKDKVIFYHVFTLGQRTKRKPEMWLNHHPTKWASQLPKVQSRDEHCSRRTGKMYTQSQQSTLDVFKDLLKHFSLHALKMLFS